jgi:hypothetical protein
MTDGLSTRAFIEDGPVDLVARLESTRSTARSWRVLNEACRLAAIEHALRPANDEFPIAL